MLLAGLVVEIFDTPFYRTSAGSAGGRSNEGQRHGGEACRVAPGTRSCSSSFANFMTEWWWWRRRRRRRGLLPLAERVPAERASKRHETLRRDRGRQGAYADVGVLRCTPYSR
ncbi:hypothetical protein CGRA01v4_04037 [Colletotrichum graminicola]|nr:hypothetical protein CGRA01v4_04037 [Colletotrichum graminicola]